MHVQVTADELRQLLTKALGFPVTTFELVEESLGWLHVSGSSRENRIASIKGVRALIPGTGLAEAKAVVDDHPLPYRLESLGQMTEDNAMSLLTDRVQADARKYFVWMTDRQSVAYQLAG